jgi:hypothetical protein
MVPSQEIGASKRKCPSTGFVPGHHNQTPTRFANSPNLRAALLDARLPARKLLLLIVRGLRARFLTEQNPVWPRTRRLPATTGSGLRNECALRHHNANLMQRKIGFSFGENRTRY